MNIVELLEAQAAQRPQAGAIIETHGVGRTMTFGELSQRAAQGAALLRSRGVEAGDAVLIVHPMNAHLYVALAAVFQIGAVAMFIDPSADFRIIDACCELQRPSAYISSPLGQLLRLRSSAVRNISRNFASGAWFPGATRWDAPGTLTQRSPIFAAGNDMPALLTFTSGSTGIPKGAVRSHGVLQAQLAALRETLRLTPDDVDVTTLPIVLLANLACGATSLICDVNLRNPGRVDGARVYADAIGGHAASMTASPAFFGRLTAYSRAASRTLPEVRRVFCGGAPVFPSLLDELRAVAPGTDPCAVYGSTEAEPIAHVALSEISGADRAAMRGGAGLLAGPPAHGVHLRIIRDRFGEPIAHMDAAAFDRMAQPVRAPGEIVVSGQHVVPGYLGGRGDHETKFRVDGAIWHRTGDLGYVDEAGRLWLLGRCGAQIEDERGSLYPFSVESAASDIPHVERSALISAGGRRILVVQTTSADTATVERTLRHALDWASIDSIRFVRRIPVDRRHNAKVDYPALKKIIA